MIRRSDKKTFRYSLTLAVVGALGVPRLIKTTALLRIHISPSEKVYNLL